MKVFRQYVVVLGFFTVCMLSRISAACTIESDCNGPTNGVCTSGVCVCKPDYAGPACASDNPCKTETCSSQGKCKPSDDDPAVAVCTCNPGFIGTKCETVDPCATEKCNDHGKCKPDATTPSNPVCTCNPGFTGTKCDMAHACTDDTHCKNEGTCDTDTPPFTCKCKEGFEGTTCETKNAASATRAGVYIMVVAFIAIYNKVVFF